MKINILYNFKQGGWGGGNTFLKALRDEYIKKGIYENDASKADIVLFNSFPFRNENIFCKVKRLKKAGKIIIHRVDGPISKIRGKDLNIDKLIYRFNQLLVDGTVFQSTWSKEENYKLGMKKNNNEEIIINASNPSIFNRDGKINFDSSRKIKLLASSWSANPRKGFDIYKFLDENLYFLKYEMDFIGNSPIKFNNINTIEAINDSNDLAKQIKRYDIFITASKSDPCSNSLIEALNCGLPAVVLNDGGHSEIVGEGGEVFNGRDDVLEKIDKVANNYSFYQSQIKLLSMTEVAKKYYNFFERVYNQRQGKNVKINFKQYLFLLYGIYVWKSINKAKGVIVKIKNKIFV